ncbi:protein YgfX [Fulvimonas yonginensis]|uniref:Protein YgfX n=1 Tax=Fulvimonas yonginensis TaxID=1495200 RepID=A0ABU8JFQ4_9GAMM
MTSAPAIGFDYRPSRLPSTLLAAVAVLALASIALSGAPWGLKTGLAIVVLASVARALRTLSRSGIAGVGLAGENWTLYRAGQAEIPATLASFRILGTCVLLRLRTAEGVAVLLLAPDNADADVRRRLRMRLAALQPARSASL